ncbi:MAG: MG2 domain-containing protein, partial [Verrucomicrobiales bacterium]
MRFLLFILGFWATSQLMAREVDQERARAAKLEREGNWKEALELRESLLAEVVDEGSGKDLEAWTRAAGRLGKWERFDGLVQRVLERQGENRAFLLSAARVYEGAPGHGVILDGEFLRGQRMARGAQWHSVAEQNRVFAMRFARLAWERSETAGERVEALEVLARVLQRGRTGRGQSWLLADLTDLSAWPDWTEEVSLGTGDGAAVDEEGKPREFALPENWEAAASDGERWRWLRAEIRRLDAAAGARADWEWWSFCEGQYGVGTLAGFSWWRRMESEAMEGVLQVESLREDESVARLAEGVTRFHLPESYQYLKGFRELMREGKGGVYERAGDRLVGIFLNRRQRVAAAEVLAEVIERHGAGDEERRKKLRAQITEGWGRFGQTGSFFAGEPVRVPFTSRNAGEVALSLRAIDDELVMRDIFAYLEGKEGEIQRDDLDHEKMDLGRIGSRLLAENLPKYLAAEGRDWVAELEKKPAHADSLNELELGNLAPGAYWLRAEMGGRVLGWTVLWVRDLVLMQREEKAGQVFYLMDGEKGAAVRGEIDFLGYRVTHRRVRGLLGREVRKMELEVERLKGETDEAGRFVIGGKEKLERLDDFQWSAMARAGERVAFLQQMRWHWNEGGFEGYQSQKSYGISDRPVYRPGQQVQLKFWSAEARYDLGDEWKYAGKAARVEVRDAKGEVVFEQKNLRTDVFGGLTVAFDLPEDAALGAYRVDLAGAVPSGFLSFRVEEYKKPEFEVVVEGPEEPVVLGGKFQAKVRALYYHGAPVSEAEVRVHVTRQAFDEVWFPAGPWDWLYGAGYWWFSPEYRHLRGWSQWGCVRPAPPWWRGGRHQPEEEVMDRTLAIGLDGTVEVEIDTKLAQFVHGDEDHRYRITAEVVDASRRMISGSGTVLAARQPFQVTTWLDRGYARTGERVTGSFAVRTLDGKEVAHEAEATLFRLLTNEKGEVDEKEVRRWAVEGGKVDFEASEAGQFRLAIKAKDKAGREASGAAVLTVLGEATEGEFAFNDLELIPDRKSYAPGDSLRLLVNVREPGSRVLLFVRPGQGAAEERLDFVVGGQSQVVEIPLTQADMPNIFLEGLV